MATDHPVPSGESPLEERLASDAKLLRKSLDRHFRCMVADDVLMARYELARLTAEVARLAAERDRALDGVLDWTSRCLAAEAEAARYREALEETDRDLAEVEDLALGKTVERIAAVRAKVYAALTPDTSERTR